MTNVSLRDRLIAYALLPAVTPARMRLLIESFESFADICNASVRLLQGLLSIDAAGAEEILAPLRNDDIRRQVEALRATAVTLADPEYPARQDPGMPEVFGGRLASPALHLQPG